jgi:hypothetical protein
MSNEIEKILFDTFDVSIYTIVFRPKKLNDVYTKTYSIFESHALDSDVRWDYDDRCVANISFVDFETTTEDRYHRHHPTLLIESIKKGKFVSGSKMLTQLEKMATRLSIHDVILTDYSSLSYKDSNGTYSVFLDVLGTLCDGKTWYNKRGYRAANQNDIDSYNATAIKKSVCFASIHNNFLDHEYFLDKHDKSIQEVFREIREKIRSGDTKDIPLYGIVLFMNQIRNDEEGRYANHNIVWITGRFVHLSKPMITPRSSL